jgi:hypothetical protein
MPEQIIYMRGFQPPLDPTASEEMARDLKVIASLPDEQVNELHRRLAEAKGFLDPKTLLATLREVLEDSNVIAVVRTALRAFTSIDVERMLEGLEASRENKNFPFDQETFERLKRVLPKLITDYPGWVRFKKAERLATVTGNELESVEIICDLRPIFDEKREKLEGMIPYTRLRVIATGTDGLPKSFEAELSRQQVEILAEKANKAKEKLAVLSESIQSWIPGGLPDLPLTRIPRKDSKDA